MRFYLSLLLLNLERSCFFHNPIRLLIQDDWIQEMTGSLRRYLEGLGLVITEDGKHYRITYRGDSRYHTTLAKTGSDHREGDNIAMQVIRGMF